MTTTVHDLAARLAAIKAMRDELARVEKETKAAYQALAGPGDSITARFGGEAGGKVSFSDPVEKLAVVSESAFLAWCKTHRPGVVVTRTVEVVPVAEQTALLAEVVETGVLPDGVALRGVAPVVSVRVSEVQRGVVLEALRSGRLGLPELLADGREPA